MLMTVDLEFCSIGGSTLNLLFKKSMFYLLGIIVIIPSATMAHLPTLIFPTFSFNECTVQFKRYYPDHKCSILLPSPILPIIYFFLIEHFLASIFQFGCEREKDIKKKAIEMNLCILP